MPLKNDLAYVGSPGAGTSPASPGLAHSGTMLAAMPDEAVVSKDELLAVLRANRENHRATFLKAQEGFRARAIKELDRSLADARAGNEVRLAVHLPVPEDHTDDYDREIRMLEMHQEPTVKIRAQLFDQIVMDRWGWSHSFNATSSPYLR